VIRRAGVEDPAAGPHVLPLFITKMEKDLLLDEVDARWRIDGARRRQRWCGMGNEIGRLVYLRLNGDIHEGPILFLLDLGHMGRGLFLLATAILGPVARLPAGITAVTARWLAAAGVAGACALAVTAIALPGS